ncbi:MAG: substrate-binding domain-containing protein [Parvibaculaceae bacterium]
MPVTGLGPRGEAAASPLLLKLTESDSAEAAARRFSIAVVLHTTRSDWARQQLAGIASLLGQHQAAIVDVVDCGFDTMTQVKAFESLIQSRVDAVISIPVDLKEVAHAHRGVHQAGKKLILLDNAPIGLLPGTDYSCVVSADNFGLGQIAAQLLSPQAADGATVGMLTYGVDFFVTHEREIAFNRWMASNRPGTKVIEAKFNKLTDVADATKALIKQDANLAALFVVWDEPAAIAIDVLSGLGSKVAVTTVDLGNTVAINMAKGGNIKGIAAQKPYDQGKAAAAAVMLALLDRNLPSWIALPGLSVTPDNVIEAYQSVWHMPAPRELLLTRARSL